MAASYAAGGMTADPAHWTRFMDDVGRVNRDLTLNEVLSQVC